MAPSPSLRLCRKRAICLSGIAFALNVRSIQPHDMHERSAVVSGEFPHFRADALIFRHQLDEFANDVAKPMKVLLACDLARLAARSLARATNFRASRTEGLESRGCLRWQSFLVRGVQRPVVFPGRPFRTGHG